MHLSGPVSGHLSFVFVFFKYFSETQFSSTVTVCYK